MGWFSSRKVTPLGQGVHPPPTPGTRSAAAGTHRDPGVRAPGIVVIRGRAREAVRRSRMPELFRLRLTTCGLADSGQTTMNRAHRRLLYHFCRLRLPAVLLPLPVFERHLQRAFDLNRAKPLGRARTIELGGFLDNLSRPRLVPGLRLPGRAAERLGDPVRRARQPDRLPARRCPAYAGGASVSARRGTAGTGRGRFLGLSAGRRTRGLRCPSWPATTASGRWCPG